MIDVDLWRDTSPNPGTLVKQAVRRTHGRSAVACLLPAAQRLRKQRLQSAGHTRLPLLDTAVNAFNTLGNRPEEFRRALREMCNTTNLDPDLCLPVIATTLHSAAAETDIGKVEQLGSLAVAIMNRVVCAADGVHQPLFSQEAATAYTREIGREVRIEEIQPVVNALMADNVLMRRGHGLYDLVDPFMGEIWLERHTTDAAQPFLA